jgi:RNA polymerase sigma-70 factor, ECF subfamily
VTVTIFKPTPPRDPIPGSLGEVLAQTAKASSPSEAQWVALVRAIGDGNQMALRELYGRMHRLVFTIVLRIVQNREATEEVTLDVFHEVWRRASRYDASGGTVVGWVMNQARSRAIDRLRFDQRKKRVSLTMDDGPASVAISTEDMIDAGLQKTVLNDALGHLTKEERQAIEIAYFGGRTYAEVAQELGEPPGTIKTRIRSGLIKLRHRLARAAQPR